MVIKFLTENVNVSVDEPNIEDYEAIKFPDRYSDICYVGGGSFGCVVSVEDSVKNEKVVIKKLRVNQKRYIKNILREIIILRLAKNLHVAEQHLVYMDLSNNGLPTSVYIVMQYCGKNLGDYICDKYSNQQALTLTEISDILYSIAKGLNFLHQLAVYHRDLKPGNVCINMADKNFPAKIIDLGLARVKPIESSEITRRIATVCYRAPENLLNLKYKEELDVWSLGCIFGYMLTNKHVFRKRGEERGEIEGTMQRVFEILGSPPKSFADLVIENERKIIQPLFNAFKKLLKEYPDHCPLVDSLFTGPSYEQDPKKDAGIKLMEGMLKWEPSSRYTISDVIESEFIADIRLGKNLLFEELPEKDLRDAVKLTLSEYDEDFKKLKGDQSKEEYLFDHIRNTFPRYPDSKDPEDYFDYGSQRKQNKGTPHVRHLQTLIVVGTLLGAICAPIIGDKELLFSVKLLASGTALVFTLSVFKYFIQR